MQQQGLILPPALSYLQYILNAALILSLSSSPGKNLPNPLRHGIDILVEILNSNLVIPDIYQSFLQLRKVPATVRIPIP